MPVLHEPRLDRSVIKPLNRWGNDGPERVNYWFGQSAVGLKTQEMPIVVRAYVDQRIADAFTLVMQAIVVGGDESLVDMSDYGGTFADREARSGGTKSPHAWGIAMDLNVHHFGFVTDNGDEAKNPLKTNYKCSADEIAPSLERLAQYFNAYGFTWGGHWGSPIDPMHFEATELTVKLLEGGQFRDYELNAMNDARMDVGLPLVGVHEAGREGKLVLDGKVVGTYILPPGVDAQVKVEGDYMLQRDRIYLEKV